MAQELPEHMIFLILLWLPVKSLLRFKAVCKYWYALIESSTFINQHHRHQQDNVNCSLIIRKCPPPKSGYYNNLEARFFMLTGDKFDEASICLDFAYEEMRGYKINSLLLISRLCVGNICNGIISLHVRGGCSEDVALWNPATKQLRPLPLPQFPASRPPQPYFFLNYPLLGFDIKTNDYKVVNIIQTNESNFELDTPSQVEVYNLSTDAWRILHRDYLLPFSNSCYSKPKVLYKSGICFWCGRSSKYSKWQGHWVLISFDFSTETFRFMPMPNTSKWVYTYALDFLDDNLICFNDPVTDEFIPDKVYNLNKDQHFDIWVLHGYGTKESWSKLYTIGPFDCVRGPFDCVRPLMFLKEEFLMLSKNSRIYLYNLVTQELQDYHYKDPCGHPVCVIYNESLVSIKGVNGAANRETSMRQFARVPGYRIEIETETETETEEEEDEEEEEEEEEDETDEERVESQSEEECEEDREIKDLENQISNELDLV
ncbi:hypothetical protein AQUCO_00200735v1 [Aquilegia coerulea]|uniref:F-box domain-containing protein n=1 Tax=Aquilegia coerulea TaxID=218851 RepID=A0A2G5F4N0_AQUCA|nr:hypothetical protein AQUCO_00200735v1 [Aquilegia coerulea]PIA62921.1 hypothetical protein AQUCO_00200735v1 [Aquilegia coerulea]PIA62922.1 hypothetical protein AQUCO_00200735v1 [Aquilegia coerulea]